MATAKFYLDTRYKRDKVSVRFIFNHGEASFNDQKYLNLKVLKSKWDKGRQEITGMTKEAVEVNDRLYEIRKHMERIAPRKLPNGSKEDFQKEYEKFIHEYDNIPVMEEAEVERNISLIDALGSLKKTYVDKRAKAGIRGCDMAIRAVSQYAKEYSVTCNEFASEDKVSHFTDFLFYSYRTYRNEVGLANKSAVQYLIFIRKALKVEGIDMPSAKIKTTNPPKFALEPWESDAIFDGRSIGDKETTRRLMCIFLCVGLRISDGLTLDYKRDFMAQGDQFRFSRNHIKTGIDVDVLLPQDISNYIEGFRKSPPTLKYHQYVKHMRELMADFGLDREVKRIVHKENGNVVKIGKLCDMMSTHKVRATFATLMQRKGVPKKVAANIGGWKRIQTMEDYYEQYTTTDADEAVEKTFGNRTA